MEGPSPITNQLLILFREVEKKPMRCMKHKVKKKTRFNPINCNALFIAHRNNVIKTQCVLFRKIRYKQKKSMRVFSRLH